LQLFAIGVIGEYIARMHFRTMGKPPYTIREEVQYPTIPDQTKSDPGHDSFVKVYEESHAGEGG